MSAAVLVLGAALLSACQASGLDTRFRWKQIDFDWNTNSQRLEASIANAYKPSSNIPVGVEVWKDKVFLTIPRWKSGVAASLVYFDKNTNETSPLVRPYPSWEAHHWRNSTNWNDPNNPVIVSPFRIRADRCDRLWVLDTGVSDLYGDLKVLRPPSILIFDLHTNKLIRQYDLPEYCRVIDSFFAALAVDEDLDRCGNTFAYLSDLSESGGIVVYDFQKNVAWRVKHHYFKPDPLQGTFNIQGHEIHWADGVFGVSLSDDDADGNRTLFFHPFSSLHEFSVSTSVLRRNTSQWSDFKVLGQRKQNWQSSASFLHQQSGVLFYTLPNLDAIGCWNSTAHSKYSEDNQGIVAKDSKTLVFPNDLKVDIDGNLWVLSDRMPLVLDGIVDPDVDYIYYLLSAPVQEAVAGTVCSGTGHFVTNVVLMTLSLLFGLFA